MFITAFNPSLEELEKTYLSIAESAGTTEHKVKNASNFAVDDFVQIGEPGREKSEIVQVSAVTDTTITTGATLYSHDANDPIYRLRYNQIRFYRSTSGVNGTYSVLATIGIDVDQEELTTAYDDTTGISSYYYKIAFYNSQTTVESSLSDPIPGDGYDRGTVGYFVNEFLNEVGDEKQEFVDRNEILGWLNDVNDDLIIGMARPYNFLATRVVFARTASQGYIDYPTNSETGEINMWKFDRLRHYNSSTETWTTLQKMPIEEFEIEYSDQDETNDTTKHYALDENQDKIRLGPAPKTDQVAAYYLYYWVKLTELDGESDRFQTPTQKVYKDYCMMKFYRKKQVQDSSFRLTADKYEQDYIASKFQLQRHTRRDQGKPMSMTPPSTPQSRHKGNRSYD